MTNTRKTKLDFYTLRAAEMFHVSYGQVMKEQRNECRRILLANHYGGHVDPVKRAKIFAICADDSIKYAN